MIPLNRLPIRNAPARCAQRPFPADQVVSRPQAQALPRPAVALQRLCAAFASGPVGLHQRIERRQHDMVPIYFEEATKLLACVAAPEAIGP